MIPDLFVYRTFNLISPLILIGLAWTFWRVGRDDLMTPGRFAWRLLILVVFLAQLFVPSSWTPAWTIWEYRFTR